MAAGLFLAARPAASEWSRGALIELIYRHYDAAQKNGEWDGKLRTLAMVQMLGERDFAIRGLIDSLYAAEKWADVVSLTTPLRAHIDEANPNFPEVAYLATIGRHRFDGKTKDEAVSLAVAETIDIIDAGLRRRPDDKQLLHLHAFCCDFLGRYQSLLDDVRRLEQLGERSDFVLHTLVLLLRSIEFPEVARHLDEICDRLPDDPEILRNWYMVMMSAGADTQVLGLAARIARHWPSFSVIAPLHALSSDPGWQPEVVLGRPPSGRAQIFANLVCWGTTYIDLMARATIPSLLAAGNLPAVCADHDLVIEIMTDAAGVAQICDLPGIVALATLCQIKIFLLPEALHAPGGGTSYAVFGYCARATILRARAAGADIIFLMPDLIYGDGSFGLVARIKAEGKRAFFADGLNVAATPMLEALVPYRAEGGALTISCRALCGLVAGKLMPRTTLNLFASGAQESIGSPSRVVFRRDFGLSINSFTKGPIYVSHSVLLAIPDPSYGTPDAWFAQQVLDQIAREELYEVRSAEDFILIELNDSTGFMFDRQPIDLEQAILNFFRYDKLSERLYWLFETSVDYPIPGNEVGVMVDEAVQTAFLERIGYLFKTHPIFTELLAARRRT